VLFKGEMKNVFRIYNVTENDEQIVKDKEKEKD